eukprot:2082071-Pyramimonas_sp.AAC.1
MIVSHPRPPRSDARDDCVTPARAGGGGGRADSDARDPRLACSASARQGARCGRLHLPGRVGVNPHPHHLNPHPHHLNPHPPRLNPHRRRIRAAAYTVTAPMRKSPH